MHGHQHGRQSLKGFDLESNLNGNQQGMKNKRAVVDSGENDLEEVSDISKGAEAEREEEEMEGYEAKDVTKGIPGSRRQAIRTRMHSSPPREKQGGSAPHLRRSRAAVSYRKMLSNPSGDSDSDSSKGVHRGRHGAGRRRLGEREETGKLAANNSSSSDFSGDNVDSDGSWRGSEGEGATGLRRGAPGGRRDTSISELDLNTGRKKRDSVKPTKPRGRSAGVVSTEDAATDEAPTAVPVGVPRRRGRPPKGLLSSGRPKVIAC